MIRVAGYCRVSTDQEDQANSFAAQCRYFRAYIENNPQWELYEIYADEGITGTSTRNRIRFNQMIDDAYAGKFQLILTKEVSRFSRNILDTIRYTRELKDLEIGVWFVTDGINTLEPDAELRLSIMGSIAQEESRKTSQRVKWGQTRQMERGIVFGHSLLGYDVKNGAMTVNEAEAVTVERIFRQYAIEGMSAAAIARSLERDGIRTRSGSSVWRPSYIIKILKNEKYVGDLVQKKTITTNYLTHRKKYNHGQEQIIRIRDHHTPIVSRALWAGAQERLSGRARRSGTNGTSDRYVLSGKVRCGVCGKCYTARVRKRKDGRKYRAWQCCGIQIGDALAMRMLKEAMDLLPIKEEKLVWDISRILREARKVTGAPEEDMDSVILDIIRNKPDAFCRELLDEIRIESDRTAEIRLKKLPLRFVFQLSK